ncbi:anthranilate synthase component I family protein [Flavobacterium sp.]|uniref:anthranilate synthase component I family protein n=1 Tax=Flavobacterium sp. TaxID=239 RepID=UPI0025BEBFDB|nr:anthranilate synthase component I family protein [Flavobacterium sp.]MBA4154216.1 aminodeoxychorismate synthase component I [Flavobacterium sp.]
MLRTVKSFTLENPESFKSNLLEWANQFKEVVFLDTNKYHQKYSTYDAVLAVDAFTSIKTDYFNAFEDLQQYQSHTKDWLFGYLSYDLKNDTEALTSKNFDGLAFPDLYFFQPKKLFFLKENQLEVQYLRLCDDEIADDFSAILNAKATSHFAPESSGLREIKIQQRISNEAYLVKVSKMLEHIHHGDIYEANFCMEFYSEEVQINPLEIYQKLNKISEPPFAVYFKNSHHYLLSASPERYLKKEGTKVILQPIKGTSRRNLDPILDEQSKMDLENNPKERAENIMIVDLVRNDLSRTATKGSVEVEELCKIYTFKQVHQMISTVVSQVEITTSPVEILKTTFPMGSMTGAPKISAMQIIEKLEETKRGLYSGAVGYFTPEGDFDFNVVIRSILYNAENQYLSFSVGSAITSEATPEGEYEECLLKAKAMFEVLK